MKKTLLRNLFLRLLSSISIALIFHGNPSIASEEPLLRVLLSDSKSLSIRADAERRLIINGLRSRSKNITSIKLRAEKGRIQFRINGNLGPWIDLDKNAQLKLRTRHSRGVWLGKHRYAGELRVKLKAGRLRVVNHLLVEKYLKSVVGSEMPKSWPIEALKAQAVAARTYALTHIKSKKDFDINATENDQVYLGLEAETLSTMRAVNTTRSLVLIYKNKLIDAVFHSNGGKQTESSGNIWKHQKPYLISVPDFGELAPSYHWTKTFHINQANQLFPEVGDVNAIQIIKKSFSQRILIVKVYGSKGNVFLNGKELRNRLGLKSALVTFRFLPDLQLQSKNLLQEEKSNKIEHSDLQPLHQDRPDPLPIINKNMALVVIGFGAGHGVGMSQWGANFMANNGKSFRSILRHYYKGVRIVPFSIGHT